MPPRCLRLVGELRQRSMRTVCQEYERLLESYQLSVKSWIQTMLSFDAGLGGLPGTRARRRRQKALGERNLADELITAHELVCPQCKGNTWKVLAGSQKRSATDRS